ncbi:MAG: glutamine--tRNA ligase [Cytophagales bacterium]|nr:glutamine--tRNA ligase [Cytophagales bacterium]
MRDDRGFVEKKKSGNVILSPKDPFTKSFIYQRLKRDLSSDQRPRLRFPPEPNGYLHLGHLKAIFLNFELALAFGGTCHIRFDDTDPVKESHDFVQAIQEDIDWLGYEIDKISFTSEYFEKLYEHAIKLIKIGKAYVDEHSSEDFAKRYKGTPTSVGKESPFRNGSIDENLEKFQAMREGKYPEGHSVLRAKIDMSSPNMHLRDPALYRIKYVEHFRSKKKWCIYPMYDFAHSLSDSMERITHSLCTMEFEPHRPLYEWLIQTLDMYPSRQIEFSRLNLSGLATSKRDILSLISSGQAEGWDDPHVYTLSGLRRRGYSPESLKDFIRNIGLSRREQVISPEVLDAQARKHLNRVATRRMVVLDPLKLTLTNYPDSPDSNLPILSGPNNPENPKSGRRELRFGKHLWIDKKDFKIDPPADFYRLAPGREVRLKYAYIIRCHDYLTNDLGEVIEVLASYDPKTRSGLVGSQKKVASTLSWVEKQTAIPIRVRECPSSFSEKDRVFSQAWAESVLGEEIGEADKDHPKYYQFERIGYFVQDKNVKTSPPLFLKTVSLRSN